jgi:hypothetical protein
MTLTPGKLYRLKNCGWFVFKCNGKLVALDETQKPIVMFIKEQEMEGLDGSNLFFLHEDAMLETNSRISNNGRDLKEISQYLEEVV